MDKIIFNSSMYEFDKVKLVPANQNLAPLSLTWRNCEENRKWFNTQNVISLEDHLSWFSAYLQKEGDFCFFALTKKGEPFGFLSAYNVTGSSIEIGRFVAAPEFKGRGYMKVAISHLVEWVQAYFPSLKIKLEVQKENTNAIGLYKSLGFEVYDETDVNLAMELI